MHHQLCCQPDKPHPHTNQLLNHVVDCIAARRPCTLFGEYPISPTTSAEGFIKINYGRLAKAIDHFAHWLVEQFGHGRNFETLAYIGPNDLRYPALVLGSIKAGYQILMLSPRNTIAAQLHLMKATNCTKFLTPSQRSPPVTAVLADAEASRITAHDVPSVEELLCSQCAPFPYNKTLTEAASDPFVVMHTSGSTGMPKPVTWRQSFIPAYAKQWQLDAPAGMESVDHLYQGNRAWVVFPPFHAAYAAHVYINGMCNQTSIIFPPSGVIPSAIQLSQALKQTSIDVALLVPAMIEEMSFSPELLGHISANIDRLIFSGGDVPRECGDRVSSKVELLTFYGTTEFASLPFVCPCDGSKTNKDWKYLSFHPASGVEFQPHADNLYELVLVRKPELERHQPVFTTFADITEYRTKDLYTPHPRLPGLWTHCGRADDIVVFSTGEKTNPVTFEQSVFAGHSEISGVVLVGAKRFQAALLIELAESKVPTATEKEELLDLFWPSVELANQDSPAHAKVQRPYIWFTDPKRPMARSPKGTIQRAATLREYSPDLNVWYKEAEALSVASTWQTNLDARDPAALLAHIKEAVQSVTGKHYDEGENFFIAGMDSLQALVLSRNLKARLQDSNFAVSTIYAAPSIRQLFTVIQHKSTATSQEAIESRQQAVEATLDNFTKQLDELRFSVDTRGSGNTNHIQVLLTGSTGSLGSHILDDLLQRSNVSHVYCLNRAPDGGLAQQLQSATEATFTAEFKTDRVTFLHADLTKQDLGLSEAVLKDISANVDLLIHNAWSVNFNKPLSSFEPQLEGVINLINLAATGLKRPTLVSLSSVAAVSNFKGKQIPESVVKNSSAPAAMGYGESKYVGERLLQHASDRLSLDVKILRVGQIAGSLGSNGRPWNQQEWFPSLVRSSAYLQSLPEDLPGNLADVNWVPVDALSQIVLELSMPSFGTEMDINGRASGERIPITSIQPANSGQCVLYNIVNQNPVSWTNIVPFISSGLPSQPKLVPFSQWLEIVKVKLAGDTGADHLSLVQALERNPAAKLLDFFEESSKQVSSPTWQSESAATSPTLRYLEGIRGEWIQKWMARWLE